ncbi:MAG: transglutaminase family protein [Burkholderiales bacterium]
MGSLEIYLHPGVYIDSDHPAVIAYARQRVRGANDVERGVSLYYAVRDGIRYNPFLDFTVDSAYRASDCLAAGEGFCVGKAALLAACARAEGIPARVGFADVRNHLSTPRLLEYIGSDLFVYHGYSELFLGGKWVKATPAFNLALCTKFRVKPLEFDGHNDSIFHPYDADQRRHMEYLRDRGTFADVPAAEIQEAFREFYPRLYGLGRDAAHETFG